MYRFFIFFLLLICCLLADSNNDKLSFFLGEWKVQQQFYDCDWWKAGEGTATADVRKILQEKFFEMNFSAEREGSPSYVSRSLFHYDSDKKTFSCWQFDSYGYTTTYAGDFAAEDILVIESNNGWLRERKTYKILGENQFSLVIESSIRGKKFQKILFSLFSKQISSEKMSEIEPVFAEPSLEKQLQNHVSTLAEKIGERNSVRYTALYEAIRYIEKSLAGTSLTKKHHSFKIGDKEYSNLVFEKKGKSEEVIIVGAHYDSARGTPGADDNASGVACLLELAKLMDKYDNQHTIRFVFFTLEEPPFFRTSDMGSTRYAKYLKDNNETVKLMICLEMLGFYSDDKIQKYPNPVLKQLYPQEANYIAIVSNQQNETVTKNFFHYFKTNTELHTQILIAPPSITGVDFSDHLSFWKYGYPALMVTDTSFYRNDNYHENTDTPETLDYSKMEKATLSICKAIKKLDK